jgi:(2R)-ethylmalonyl-CoA mutase
VQQLRARIAQNGERLGHRPRIVVAKPGLDGHSNGAEVIAVSARHVGFDVIYAGIRLSPEEIVRSAVEEDADVIGASVLSGSHVELASQIMTLLDHYGARDRIRVALGGIVPPDDLAILRELGVERVFTPSDYELIDIMESIADLVESTGASGGVYELAGNPAGP